MRTQIWKNANKICYTLLMRSKKTKTIIIIASMASKAARDQLSGLLHVAKFYPEWDLRILSPEQLENEKRESNHYANFDAVVILNSIDLSATSIDPHCPTVIVDCPDVCCERRTRVQRIIIDNTAIGRIAAERFLRRGFVNFAYVGDLMETEHDAMERCEGFRRILSAVPEHTFSSLLKLPKAGTGDTGLATADAAIDKWIVALPKPCAVFAYSDIYARQILSRCRHIGISVPQQISVISVDNDTLICENTRPTLSSIDVDFEEPGTRAAQCLRRLLSPRGKIRPPIAYRTFRLVERQSTFDSRGTSRIVENAMKIIRTQALTHITISDIARKLSVSTRTLQQRFRAAKGHGPKEELQNIRLNAAKRLLMETSVTIEEISERCGFNDPSALKKSFKCHTGHSMREYRSRGPHAGSSA